MNNNTVGPLQCMALNRDIIITLCVRVCVCPVTLIVAELSAVDLLGSLIFTRSAPDLETLSPVNTKGQGYLLGDIENCRCACAATDFSTCRLTSRREFSLVYDLAYIERAPFKTDFRGIEQARQICSAC